MEHDSKIQNISEYILFNRLPSPRYPEAPDSSDDNTEQQEATQTIALASFESNYDMSSIMTMTTITQSQQTILASPSNPAQCSIWIKSVTQ